MLLGGRKFGQPHGSYKTCNGQKLQLRKCVPVIFKTSTNQTVPRVLTNESFISEVRLTNLANAAIFHFNFLMFLLYIKVGKFVSRW